MADLLELVFGLLQSLFDFVAQTFAGVTPVATVADTSTEGSTPAEAAEGKE